MSTNGEPSPIQVSEQDLNAFVDGVLDDERRVDLLAHLATHPLDAEKVNGYFRQKVALEELRDALAEDDDSAFLPELQRRIDGAVARQRLFTAARRLAAGLAIVAPIAALTWWTAGPQDEPVVASVSETELPVAPIFPFGGDIVPIESRAAEEGAASLGRLAHYLDNRALAVPDLGRLGLSLIGGEAIPGVELPAARLIYEDERDNRLLVYVAVAEDDAQQAVTIVPEGHISLNWRSGPLVFAVVGPAGTPKLLEVMRSITHDITEVAETPAAMPAPAAEETIASEASADLKPLAMPEPVGASPVGIDSVVTPQRTPVDRKIEPELVPLEESQPKV
jgi:anti-sigma factor RsiW